MVVVGEGTGHKRKDKESGLETVVVGEGQDIKEKIKSPVSKRQLEGGSSANAPLHGGEGLV